MPRKTKAELAAEKEALENTEMEAIQQEPGQEVTPLPAEEEGAKSIDTASLPEYEPQEAAIAGLLADYSAASREDSGEGNEPEPQEKSPHEEEGEAASSTDDFVSADSEQRRHFASLRRGHEPGVQLKCSLLVVGPRRVLAECGGYDVSLSQRDLSWTAIADLRNEYRPGQELPCRLKEYSNREGKLSISVRNATPSPFIGDDVTVLCLYSNLLGDNEFFPGDSVLIHITQYDYNRQLIYGRIISKW